LLFPWIENKLQTVNPNDNSTAYAFLMLMKNLRWVIIQDSAILLGKYKRKHFIFKKYKSIFESELFLDYQRKMLIHIDSNKDQDSLMASVEGVLPGVKQCITKQTNAIEKQKDLLIKIDEDVIDLKESIETDNSKNVLKSNLHELLTNLCDHIGEFGTKMNLSPVGDVNKRKYNSTIFTSRKRTKGSVDDVINVDENQLNPEIPLMFKDFSSVLDFHMKIFGKKKKKRLMFPLMVKQHRKRLQRFNLVISYFNDHVDKVGRTKALDDYSKVFNNQSSGLKINRFLNHIHLIK